MMTCGTCGAGIPAQYYPLGGLYFNCTKCGASYLATDGEAHQVIHAYLPYKDAPVAVPEAKPAPITLDRWMVGA